MQKVIIVTDTKAGKAKVSIMELDIDIPELIQQADEIKKLQQQIRELEAEPANQHEYSITTPAGGTIEYSMEKCSLQDTQIMEALEQAYTRIGATQLLSVLEGL